ncbi:MAG TPA: SurA N-terminal domain-containing protein, partial [Candidatus Binataceae bacterium]|nr:SurA N-terminal domain-containing protein [Candidatus Binataceae bacterium]
MLDKMRGHSRSWITWVLVGLPTLGLTFWGLGGGLFNQVKPIADVNGTRILSDQVDRIANRMRQRYEQELGTSAGAMLKQINLRQQALDSIIEDQLVADEVRRLGIQVSDEALQQRIASDAVFQTDGQFDFARYQELLEQNDLTPAQFESDTRSQMAEDTLREMIDQGVQVAADEAHHAYNLTHQKIGLRYIEAGYADFIPQISPTDKQIADYYAKHGGEFREPERVKIAIIHYDPDAMSASYVPTDAEIKDYYQRNLQTRFTKPELAHASHILIATPPGATEQEIEKAKAKAQDILKQAETGANFAQLAEKYSDDPGSKSHGGDLGDFPRGEMVKPFEDRVFSLKPGEFGIVQTQYGFHIIMLDHISPAHTETLEEARPKIIDSLRQETGSRLVHTALDEDVAAALAGTNLKSIADKRGLSVTDTDYFSQAGPVLGGKDDRELAKEAFQLARGQPRAIPAGGAPYLIELIDRKPSRIPPLKEIEAKVREALIRSLAQDEARAAAQKALASIKGPDDFDRAAAENHLALKTVESFESGSHVIPGIGAFPEVTDQAGMAPSVPSVLQRVMEQGGNAYIFELTSRAEPSDE